jgi:hypothetical protein
MLTRMRIAGESGAENNAVAGATDATFFLNRLKKEFNTYQPKDGKIKTSFKELQEMINKFRK